VGVDLVTGQQAEIGPEAASVIAWRCARLSATTRGAHPRAAGPSPRVRVAHAVAFGWV